MKGAKAQVAERIVREIANRLEFLVNVGLDYLSLERSAETLSGGEAQRIRLASQIGSGLTGVMYVLDEPSIGLHQRDNARLIGTLKQLRDLGNSVIVVEHDEEAIRAADYVVDMGPGAGEAGGRIVAQGTPAQVIANPESLTGRYLARAARDRRAAAAQRAAKQKIVLHGAQRQQPERGRPRVAARAARLRHRRFRLGQVHPGQRHAVCRGGAHAVRLRGRARAASRASPASSRSTR